MGVRLTVSMFPAGKVAAGRRQGKGGHGMAAVPDHPPIITRRAKVSIAVARRWTEH